MHGTDLNETGGTEALLSKCVSIDLEVDPNTNRIRSFAAVRPGAADSFVYRSGNFTAALRALDDYAQGAEFALGHNIIEFDWCHLEEADSNLRVLKKPLIDTLWLNPLAFPRNPYHRLVKHYKDGALQGGNASDPEVDARLVLTVLQNQISALRKQVESDPDNLKAFHLLAAPDSSARGFDTFFQSREERTQAARAGGAERYPACPRRQSLHPSSRTADPGSRTNRLAARLRARLDPGSRRDLRHAALGPPPVSRGRRDRSKAARHLLRGPGLPPGAGPGRTRPGF